MSTPLLAAKLADLRQQFNYSQQELATYLSLSREAYSHYERGVREPSLETLVKLSKLYKIDISELINEETILTFSIEDKKQVEKGSTTTATAFTVPNLNPFSIPSTLITNNIKHFLKLFTGKNATTDFTNISKEDMAVLAQYKKLNKHNQKEVRQFIKFKQQLNKE